MSRADKIYIVRALILKLLENFNKPFLAYLLAETAMADLVILAENTFERTPREKDGSASPFSADTRLLPEVKSGSRQLISRANTANADGFICKRTLNHLCDSIIT